MRLGTLKGAAFVLAGSFAAIAVAQTGGGQGATGLNIPSNPQFIGNTDPSTRKATAIVNGDVITQTDVDQRMALILLANQGTNIPADELQRLRDQVLRNLVDETLQIQAAKAAEIKIEQREIDTFYNRYVQNLKQSPQQFEAYLRSSGSSPASLKRQIHGEVAWSRLQSRKIEPFVNVAQEEVPLRHRAAEGCQRHAGVPRRRNLPVLHPGNRGRDSHQCDADRPAASAGCLLPGLCAPILRSLHCRGRRRPRLGA
jgi:peptidyl-prolyl cis-trans isomerase SurA